tara:strand:- start:2367 stop:3026 length:660 start_codon:yes stop_codon:yes gene_type:complete
MSDSLFLVVFIFFCYLIGSTPTSIIAGRIIRGIDIREHGSGNAGGTNVFRVLGWKPGLFVIVVDMLKGWIPVSILAPEFYKLQIVSDLGVLQILSGFSAVIGHTYTIFARFKGGKGVGTLGGMMIALFPTVFPFCLAIAALTIVMTGYVSLASIIASCSLPILLLIIPPLMNVSPAPLSIMIFSLLVPWFIIYTHRSNVQRIRNGNENKFKKAMIFNRD